MYGKLADANPYMAVYKKDDVPEHFHYRHNARIMPILLEAQEGWTIVQNRTTSLMRTFSEPPAPHGLLNSSFMSGLLIASQEILCLCFLKPAAINKDRFVPQ